MSEDYKEKYYEEKFINLHKRIDSFHGEIKTTLELILNNTEKTNGSIARAHEKIAELERTHLSCPVNSLAEKIKIHERKFEEIETVSYMSKHPEILKYTLIGIGVVAFTGVILAILL